MACLKKGRRFFFIPKLFKTYFVKLSYSSGCLSCILSQIKKYGMHSSHSIVMVPFRHYYLSQKYNQFFYTFQRLVDQLVWRDLVCCFWKLTYLFLQVSFRTYQDASIFIPIDQTTQFKIGNMLVFHLHIS